jgi:hypothetical protein
MKEIAMSAEIKVAVITGASQGIARPSSGHIVIAITG